MGRRAVTPSRTRPMKYRASIQIPRTAQNNAVPRMISLRQVSQNPPIHSPCSAIELDTGRSYGTWRGGVSKRLSVGATAAGRGPEPPSTPQEMVRKVDRAAPTHRTVGRLMMRAWAAAWESRDDSTVMGLSTAPYQTAPGAPLAGSTAAGSARVWRPLSSDVTASSAAAP